jgi:hypothetical protein
MAEQEEQGMIERVAFAFYAEECRTMGLAPDPLEELAPLRRETFLRFARAAVTAMREPTADMEEAIVDVSPDRPHADYWRAGIDAALEEQQ